jgi:hypothetical protein
MEFFTCISIINRPNRYINGKNYIKFFILHAVFSIVIHL